MKKLLIALICLLTAVSAFSAPKLYRIGYQVSVCAYRFDDAYYMVLSFGDEDKCLNDQPILKLKLADGQVIKLDGTNNEKIRQRSVGHILKGTGTIITSSSNRFYVAFPISEEDINKLSAGVTKVAFNTLPSPYIKTIDDESLGVSLLKDFYSIKDEFDD